MIFCKKKNMADAPLAHTSHDESLGVTQTTPATHPLHSARLISELGSRQSGDVQP